ncbi:MAG TPA: sigma-70 family RNA polymerase sigma factor [Gemmataceae bacterium]|jgi:RNA polymerase sigma-70 factor (ECF subfamily)|nr:sigma-70 family RNA polymerase sigma factor [Gemmataceae bacterium]
MADFPATRASLLVRLRDPLDGAAWGQFIALYAPLIYGYVRKQGLQDADAADLCQDVLAAVAGAVGRLDYDPARGSFRNWLFTVVRRKLINWRNARKNKVAASGDTETRRLLEQCPANFQDGSGGSADEWQAEWDRRLFAWACEQVRPTVTASTWQAFWQTAVDCQAGKKVAADLGMSVAAVYLARSRVTARLKELVRSVEEP